MPADRSVDIGQKLREARERRGISLRQISAVTKISVAALEALERNDIARLPGGIFTRAFVRAYASEVGLRPEETVREFLAQFPHESVTAGHPTAPVEEDGEALESRRHTAVTFMRLVAWSVPIAALALYFASTAKPPDSALSSPTLASVAGSPLSPPAPAVPSTPSAAESSRGSSPASDPPDDTKLTVVLSASRPCWTLVRVDGEKVLERTLQSGEQQQLDVYDELVLTAGDAGALAVKLNGAEARSLGHAGEVVTVHVSPSNFRDYLLNP